jgi:hypothetical protein
MAGVSRENVTIRPQSTVFMDSSIFESWLSEIVFPELAHDPEVNGEVRHVVFFSSIVRETMDLNSAPTASRTG